MDVPDVDEIEATVRRHGGYRVERLVLISGTYAAATAATYAGCRWAGIDVSRSGALLVGLLVTLSLALEYGVVSAERLSPMK